MGANAWAAVGDETVNANIDFSNAITDGVVAGTVNSMAVGSNTEIKDGVLWLGHNQENTVTIAENQRAGYGHSDNRDVVTVTFSLGIGNANGLYGAFYLKDSEGNNVAYLRYGPWNGGSETNLGLTLDGNLFYKSNSVDWSKKTDFTVTLDYKAKTISTSAYNNSTKKTIESTVSMTNTNSVATFVVASNSGNGGDARRSLFDDLKIITKEGDYTVALADYRISWKSGGEEIKYEIRTGNPNSEIVLNANDTKDFFLGSKKYIYVENNLATNNTIAADGSTVVTVTVREAETWNYTIKAVDESENVLGTITTGTVVEGESIYYYYPTFFLNGTELLQADINGSTYGKGATPTENNAEYTVIYKDKGISDIVFYKEAEDIEGMTTVTAGNVPARCSNGKGASASTATKIVTLAPGKYKISGFAWGNSGTNFNVTANGANIATFTTASSTVNVTTSDEFTLTGTTDIVMGAGGNGGSSPKVIDFFYVQKTGDVELPANASVTVTAAGYATYCSEYDLNLSGVKAYTATLSGSDVTFTQQTGKVVAGTGLLIKAEAGTVNIPVVAEGAAAVTDNALVGVLANTVVGAGSFVLMNGAQGVGFYKTTADEFTVGAHTAYIAALPAGARSFIGFDFDATTGIEAVAAEKTIGEVYNLNGQRVVAPQKGLYIVNGKKVFVN